MAIIAEVSELWRYPVKSMGGESLTQANILLQGMAGDRCWAVVDAAEREIRSAKRWPDLLNFQAQYKNAAPENSCFDEAVPAVLINCPDGSQLDSNDDRLNQQLGQMLAKPLQLRALRPASDKAHYRLAKARSEADFLADMAMQAGEDFPDFSQAEPGIMAQLAEHVTPLGAYVDAFPLHMLSEDSLAFLGDAAKLEALSQRFRPNIVVKSCEGEQGLVEKQWLGRRLKLGNVILRVDSQTVRCSMPGRAQAWAGLQAVPTMARAVAAHCERFLGLNILVEQPGEIRIGDKVELLEDS